MINRLLLVLWLAFAGISLAHAQAAGRVLVALGDVSVQRGGRDITLNTGAEVFSGDLIRLGELSNAQIEFTDQGIVALRPKSVFRIDDYKLDANDLLSTAVFSLVRGGLRTFTGLIGRSQRANYRVRAPAATVGIRGTHYTLVVCQQDCINGDGSLAADGTYGGVLEGKVAISNNGGEREFGADEYFFVADFNTPAQHLQGRPGFLRDRLEARARRERDQRQSEAGAGTKGDARDERDETARISKAAMLARLDANTLAGGRAAATDGRNAGNVTGAVLVGTGGSIVVGDLRDSSGNVAVLGPGLGLSVGYSTGLTVRSTTDGGTGTAITVNSADGTLEKFRLLDGEITGGRNGANVFDSGKIAGDGSVHWGRWGPAGDVTVSASTFSPPTGVHFIYGALTPPDVLSRPVTSIGVASSSFDYAGGTNPTDGSGQNGQFLGGLFNVDFVARTIGGGVSYRIGSVTFTLPVPSGTALQAKPGVIGFSLTPRNGGNWTCACNNTSGTLDTYAISGLFLGSRAQGLGVTFATLDQVTGRTAGAAVFRCRSCKP